MNFPVFLDQFALFDRAELIKSPMNWVGGKFKLLNQILPLLPPKIENFVDMFTGGGDIALNVIADNILMNDAMPQTIEAYRHIATLEWEEIDGYIKAQVEKFRLKTEDKVNFYNYRNWYNATPQAERNPLDTLNLCFHSFNSQCTFNENGQSTQSSGLDGFRGQYNSELRANLQKMHSCFRSGNFTFTSGDFRALDLSRLTRNDYVYCDPPYIITNAYYCKNWKEAEERDLLALLQELDKRGVRLGLSNVTAHEGKDNLILKEWIAETGFYVHGLKKDYVNASPKKKFRGANASVEVFVTNFQK